MLSLMPATAVSAAFDEPNLVPDVGLVPLLRLAERVGLPRLLADNPTVHRRADLPLPAPSAKGPIGDEPVEEPVQAGG
jgi:hypothetical protein